ncbi:MAG: hypothetical protein IH624_17375 [Phycisphaerae bacterium]|nr:hypothetical protein [Phycisphaerae bacterium]
MMARTASGIDRVRVVAMANEPMHAQVRWRSTHQDMLHQVYVNGRLAGATGGRGDRSLLVALPSSPTRPLRVEVFAVPPGEAYVDFGDAAPEAQRGRVELVWLRRMGLPAAGAARVFASGGDGPVDYTSPVSEPLPIWPAWQAQGGFGMSRFGASDFGYDGSAAVGFGCGLFGEGPFGFDADAMRWVSEELADGVHRFAVTVTDACGSESAPAESEPVTVVRRAAALGALAVEAYDNAAGRLVIGIAAAK